jgi:hypothetical protein
VHVDKHKPSTKRTRLWRAMDTGRHFFRVFIESLLKLQTSVTKGLKTGSRGGGVRM